MDERGGELDALLVAERQVLDAIVRPLRDAQDLDRLGGPTRSVGPRQPVEPRQVHQLLQHLHLRIQAALLRHVPEPPSRLRIDRAPVPSDLAGVGLQHAERDAHRGRLARAVRPDEPDDLAVGDRERHAVERDDVAEPTGEVEQLEHAVIQDAEARRRHADRHGVVGGHARRRPSEPLDADAILHHVAGDAASAGGADGSTTASPSNVMTSSPSVSPTRCSETFGFARDVAQLRPVGLAVDQERRAVPVGTRPAWTAAARQG